MAAAPNNDTVVQLAVLQLKYDLLEEKLKELDKESKEKIEKLEKSSKEVSEMVSRWKGGGAALLAIGALTGFIFTYFDKFKAFFGNLGAS